MNFIFSQSQPPDDSNDTSPCPFHNKDTPQRPSYVHPKAYNVYSQEIDPKNNMPVNPNQIPSESQRVPLDTTRIASSIPKAGITNSSTWVYPSPQMFWNALVRKNKLEGVEEGDVEDVVKIHNNMNENTWKQVLSWENDLHPMRAQDFQPKLLRFSGRPNVLSPKAWIKSFFGHPLPFDRHDWIVDRGGKEVRYIIDYYLDESQSVHDQVPDINDVNSVKSIKIDVRPAIDNLQTLVDRIVRIPIRRLTGRTSVTFLPFFWTSPINALPSQLNSKFNISKVMSKNNDAIEVPPEISELKMNYEKCSSSFSTIESEADLSIASLSFYMCMGKHYCLNQTKTLEEALLKNGDNEEEIEKAYDDLQSCVSETLQRLK